MGLDPDQLQSATYDVKAHSAKMNSQHEQKRRSNEAAAFC